MGSYGAAGTYFNVYARHCNLDGYVDLYECLQVITIIILIEICHIECFIQIGVVVLLIRRSYCTNTINCNLPVCIVITVWIVSALFVHVATLTLLCILFHWFLVPKSLPLWHRHVYVIKLAF